MPVSQSRKFHANRDAVANGPQPLPTNVFEIVHPEFRPDLRGEFTGGYPIRTMPDGKQVVDLTDAQAKFHLDQGSIAPYGVAAASGASSATGSTGSSGASSAASGASGASSASGGSSGASGASSS